MSEKEKYVFVDMHGHKLTLDGNVTVARLVALGYTGFRFKKTDATLAPGEWRCEQEEVKPISSEPSLKWGDKAGFSCESCGTHPTWGSARRGWWLNCDCWTSEVFADPADVLADWTKDTARRIKAKKKNP